VHDAGQPKYDACSQNWISATGCSSMKIPPGETRIVAGYEFTNRDTSPVHIGLEDLFSRFKALKKDLELLGCVVKISIGGETKVAAKKPRTKTDKRKAARGGKKGT
jgi:hypothetical protein